MTGFVGITEVDPSTLTDDMMSVLLDGLEGAMPEASALVGEARQRWSSTEDKHQFMTWLEGALAPFAAGDEEPELAVDDECDCGAVIELPGPWVGRGVFVCDSCERRWGIEVGPDGSSVIWPI